MVDVQVAPASLGSHMPELNSEEEEEDEQWLEVAAQFVSLVLEDQPGARPLGGGKSPAASKLAPGAAREPPTSTAPEIARQLKNIGDELDAKVEKVIKEETAELLRHKSVFQIEAPQFSGVCSKVLYRCSSVMTSGWQQVSTVYLTLSQMARQVDTAHPQGQPGDVVTGRLPYFSRQCLTDVGLDTWIRGHGGMATLLEMGSSEQDIQHLDMVTIADPEP